MKRCIFFILAALFLFINCLPSSIVFADDNGYSDSQLADIGTLLLSNMIVSGEATELDFSDYTENSALDWLIALGDMAVTGDVSGLVEQGLDWLGGELDEQYDNLIESIREWEHDIAPDLYDWWYNGSKYEYKLQKAQNSSRPLSRLLRNNTVELPIQPHPDFSFLDNIAYLYVRNLEFVQNLSVPWAYNNGSGQSATWNFTRNQVSYYSPSTYLRHTYIDNNYMYYGSLGIYNGILSVNFNTTTLQAEYYGAVPFSGILFSSVNGNNSGNAISNVSKNYGTYNGVMQDYMSVNGSTDLSWTPRTDFTGAGLSTFANYIYNQFANINIYVDGQPWVLVSSSHNPIIIPGALTVLNTQPAVYSFDTPTYIDLTGLKTLITNAINSSDVLTWQDIDDYFVNVNGVQALPVVQVYRNDYDNMYLEQYPYPVTLIGFNDPLKFNENMLTNYYGQYLTPMVDVAENTIDVLPDEIKWVLGIGAILTIFAVIINRLLE